MKKSLSESIQEQSSLTALLKAIDGIVWEADAQSFEFTYINERVVDILGYTPQEWFASPTFWQEHIYYKDVEEAVNFCHQEIKESRSHTFEYRMVKADGDLVWIRDIVSVITENGIPKQLCGIMVDITEQKILADLDHLEKEVLELTVSNDSDIEKVLSTYVQGIEKLFPEMICSIMKIKNDRMFSWATPSLPKAYTDHIEGLEIGPSVGSCGTAAYSHEMVIVSDIANDERWAPYKDITLPHGLKACWSIPIINRKEEAIAVLGIYYKHVKEPNEAQIEIITRVASILKVILENWQYAAMMLEMNMLILQCQSLANFGNWQWDIQSNTVTWSGVLYNIYGLDEQSFQATFEGYQALLHPDDKERVTNIIREALVTGEDTVFEERIIRPDGEMRYLNSWGRVISDDKGNPIKMIGACLDVTKAKATQTKMDEIAWQQSHMVRAPLASLMGLVNMLKEEEGDSTERKVLLKHILETADQLDTVIRKISQDTHT